ncbi:MAG: molybdenum cofactor carrier [Hyphomicrobiales bacterium]|nr:molybdenum cofactor carrier [Hyphomicrobiales bacterium]
MKIVCGGESGVDRAALDAAIALGIPYGGWCPRGGWAEDFPDPPGLLAVYPNLMPTPSADPAQRTRWNVRDSDRTLILTGAGDLTASPGTGLTVQIAEQFRRPHRVVNAFDAGAPQAIDAWLAGTPSGIVLNVGGPRESEAPGIYDAARGVLEAALSRDEPP